MKSHVDFATTSRYILASMATIQVTRSYLQLLSPGALRGTPLRPELRIEQAHPCPISFFRYLYAEVGRAYRWRERIDWSDARCADHLADARVSIWVLYSDGAPAGYFELFRHDDRSVEIAYFGLTGDFIGRGIGKELLSAAVERAWTFGASRVWLHTCTLDDPAALPNYLARGFVQYRQERYDVPA
jgi:GNAT superfamily N-acetyltransferase